jgi:hypothetical protein
VCDARAGRRSPGQEFCASRQLIHFSSRPRS